jgi:MFS transporter, ACS family, D-galactonate transporter
MNETRSQQLVPTRYLVLCSLCTAAVIAYIQRFALGAAASTIGADLGVNDDAMGWVLSSFFWGYALFQIPSGWLADLWGTRRLLSLLALIWSLATAMTPFADGFISLFAVRFIVGSAQAGIFCCATRTVSLWFPSTERGMTSGFLGSSMSVGGAVSAMATGVLLPLLPWQWIFVLFAIPGLVWSVWFYAWFRDRPDEFETSRTHSNFESSPAVSDRVHEESLIQPGAAPWLPLLKSPTMWWVGGQQFFRAAGYVFYASWFATFLQKTRHIEPEQAAFLNSLPLWAVVIGSPVGGIVSDWVFARTSSRRIARSGVAIASMFGCALLIILAYAVPNVWLSVMLISAGSFWSALGGPSAYAVTIDVGGNRVGTVFSVMNMCGNIGAAAFPLVVPQLVKLSGDWDIVFFLLTGIYVAAGACWMLVNPNVAVFADMPVKTLG